MPGITPVFRMGFLKSGETLTAVLERQRFTIIDKQLESLYAFLGNGVISGWEIVETPGIPLSVTVTPGSAVVAGIAVKSSDKTILNNLVAGTDAGSKINYIYAKILGHSPYTADVDFVTSTIYYDSDTYLKLGRVSVDKNKRITIDMSESSGRTELTFLTYVLSLIKDHLHTGAPGDPSKIDLQEHVKGVLDASFIGNIPASKITGGTISPERFKISHNDLSDIGTLTHAELDSLVEKLQNINRILFGDIMTANLMQLYLSFKHVWPEVDQYTQNFISMIPGIGNNQLLDENTYIDINATTAEVDYVNHRIRGKSLAAREVGQVTIRGAADWNNSVFDSSFIRIVDSGMAYGYGYGYGEGLDYFDVFETDDFSFLEGTDDFVSFPGSTYGYGISSFESDFENSYGYGYGFEYGFGFPETLTSTIVTLNPQTLSTELHNKNIIDTPEVGDGNDYQAQDTTPTYAIQESELESSSKADFMRALGQNATTGSGRRSDTEIDPANDGADNIPYDLYSFYSFVVETGANGQITDSSRSASYVAWTNPVDLTINNVITLRMVQVDGTPYDDQWTFDHSFQLILEFSTDTHKFYYIYDNGDSSNRFLIGDQWNGSGTFPTVSGTNYFEDSGEILNNIARFEVTAQIASSSDLTFLGGYKISDNTPINSSADSSIPIFTTLVQGLTGVALYSDVNLGHDNRQFDNFGATYIQWPQGKRERLEQPEGYDSSSKMLAEIDKIFIGGPFGFNDQSVNNDIQNIIISFPDRVDFTSISWISEEPGDSIVYIQVNRLEEDSSSNYRVNPIWTNSLDRAADADPDVEPNFADGTEFLVSGSSLPDIYQNIRGLRLRVVLLPTTDRRVAPAIHSITINYLSNTLSNEIIVTSQDQWMDARETQNLTVSSGTVTIENIGQQYGKVRNVIYGTNKSVVETSDSFLTTVKRYGGSNLPTTVTQSLNGRSAGLSGFITDLKKMNNGDIALLDRDEGRVVILDQNYELKTIIASENVFKTSADVGAGSAGDVAVLVKAIYNRELGDNGILYLVFSHQLKAWPDVEAASSDAITTSQIFIKSKGQTLDLSDIPKTLDNIVACDRGILSFKLTSELSNFIEGSANPIVQIFLNSTTPGVKFLSGATPQSGRSDLEITKIGSKGVFSSYNLIYAPIRGIVAFDMDDSNRLMLLKRTKPYSWDTTDNVDGVWYARISLDRFWTSWNSSNTTSVTVDPYIETNINTINGTENHSSLTDPNFFINNYFGYKGSIQRYEDFLLFTFCGDKIVWVTKKDENSATEFRQPTEVTSLEDGATPMGARFDPTTTTADDYTYVYVALSDLKRGSTNNSGTSKVVKIRDGAVAGSELIWRYGAGSDTGQETKVVSCNDVRPLLYTDDGVVIST